MPKEILKIKYFWMMPGFLSYGGSCRMVEGPLNSSKLVPLNWNRITNESFARFDRIDSDTRWGVERIVKKKNPSKSEILKYEMKKNCISHYKF